MAEAAGAPAAPGEGQGGTLAPRLMLLSLWATPGQPWHARLVAPDATAHEFTSPFELARFLAQPPPRAPAIDVRSLK